ncbi:PspC domain-containing protein [Pseudonocardia acidicola]|uniref:PspC domain-containing protein n=1 Tax=Pseudonocardia acidicola TaxID=2724939 RepID=A0ABX1SJT9_9PSEU|nr:PspC domain-containing protein [Pseudonocardia acidicola]
MEPTTEYTARPTASGAAPGGGAGPWPGPAALPGAEQPAPPPAGAPAKERFALRRSRTDRMLGGVCGGLAQSLGVDAALLRIGLVALTVLGAGSGAIIYLAAWILAPEEEPAV